MTDDELLAAFETAALPDTAFRHLDHLRLAWICVHRDGPERGGARMADGLVRFAAAHRARELYNETLTRFWIRLVSHVMEAFPDAEDFDTLLERYPRLADQILPYAHYPPETLRSEPARRAWVEPDLLALP